MIHETAIVSPKARIGAGVQIGPYSIIEEHVEIGDGTVVGPHVVIKGHTRIGRDNRFFQFSSIGEVPQDKKYAGEPTRLEIGDRNTFHECCTVHIGTVQDKGVTIIGDDNWFMAYVHIAHDCIVGNNTIFANNASLAGHASVGDWAILGGFAGMHQFGRIGAHAFCGTGSIMTQDVPPYITVSGTPPVPHGINSEGLKRRGFSPESIAQIKRAYRALYRSGLSLAEAREQIAAMAIDTPEIAPLADFIADSGRGIVR
ncbi:acyl-ACP--UDP-N-acetylglucosamine O-acyltransferase [Uliginosibacterium sp. sgz301328]|uniref:acyl-ACP--UDP-N-acetylglucosamine O-acyltransferase n=1 Tax=Uliginosibacterium sp. sgz301328 TaxID=3243764 RepID=UPI00359E0BD0